jgi:two-component system, cell cycle response regulator DivK
MRVLLVEDTDDSREVIRITLQDLGHEVIEARNGREALRAAIKRSPDVVLMDLSMPEVDGLQATTALRSIRTSSHLPVIAMTVYPSTHFRDRAEDAGCDAFLQKPFTPEQLSSVLQQFKPAV